MIQLSMRDIRVQFGERKILERFNLEVAAGDFVCLLGASGCGKSTLLRLLAGLIKPDAGHFERGAGPISFVFQEPQLLPWRTVRENVELPFVISREAMPDPEPYLRQVDLWAERDLFPHQLSGGMKQRVSIARALIRKPSLLLMDEPFSALDEATRHDLEDLIRSLWLEIGCTLVFVTHALDEAVYLGERLLVLGTGGETLCDERPKLTTRDEDLRHQPEFSAHVGALSGVLRRARRVDP